MDGAYFSSDRTEIVRGDLRNRELLINSLTGVDAVIHLAALVGSYIEKDNLEVNYIGTKHLLDACIANNVQRFIFISSVSAKRKAQGPYGRSKKLAEEVVSLSELNYTIFRPTTVMGRESLGLNRIIMNVNRFPFIIPMAGTGKQTRHPVYIKDFVKLITASIKNKNTYRKLYEVGGESVIYFKDLARLINEKLGNRKKLIIPVPIQFLKMAAFIFERTSKIPPFTTEHVNSLTENTQMDVKPAVDDLSFTPIPLDKMLEFIIEEIRQDPPDLFN